MRYEDFVKNPREIMNEVLKFCKLKEDRNFLDALPKEFKNLNHKWRDNPELANLDSKGFESSFSDLLWELGYL